MRLLAPLLLAALALGHPQPAASEPMASVQQGKLTGRRAGPVDVFLGIPYAAPPVGANRWRAPQPPARWPGLRQATALSADCVQDEASNPPAPGYANRQSEDCLYLNIWRPAGSPGARLPVMVWIHGGAFIMGAGAYPTYDGRVLAGQGVIVVTINYRLGRFGVFAHPALTAANAGEPLGNYGLMDQIAALRWVRDNIGGFGGDPANVTVFGQSAGASSINFLMTSPAARGLFAKAISESGGSNANLKTLAQLEADGARWAKSKGVAGEDAAALRALPTATVLDAPVLEPAFPAIDGRIVTEPTMEAFRLGHVANVPYLVGANDYEENLLRWLPGADAAMLKRFGPEAEHTLAAYTAPGDDRARAIGRMWGEDSMTEPARRRAKSLALHGRPVWLYRFGYVPEALRPTLPGAGHDAEIQMVFGNPAPSAKAGWSVADAAMAKTVSGYWVAFAKSGDPNHPGALPWPRFTSRQDRLMSFGGAGPAVLADFGRKRLDMLEAVETRPAH